MKKPNSPGAPANTPQHSAGDEALPPGGDADRARWKHKQTGEGTTASNKPAPGLDPGVADPHPSDEEHPYRARHPGGANPPDESRDTPAFGPRGRGREGQSANDIGPNSHAHDGTPKPRPRNAETE